MNLNSRLLLKNWNLPECVLQSYEKNGLTSMFQWQADCLSIDGVLDGRNLVYAAPTSAGKTLVTEILLLKRVLETGKKALFILPFVSVSREKLFHMRGLFEEAGIRVDGYMGGHAPTNGFSSVDIAVCTIEKANGLINRLIEEKNIDQIGMLVIDELHMVGDEGRGYILELLLTKIRYMSKTVASHSQSNSNIQIVGMSATLPNLDLLADWLDASLYTTDFRPVPLQRCLKIGSSIYDEKLEKIREFSPAFSCKNDEDSLPALCYETLQDGNSVLVFCPTKNWCEKLANNIAHQFYDLISAHQKDNSLPYVKLDLESLKDVFEQLTRSPAGVDATLNRTLPLGVAYHHAGLTTEERDIIEAGFRIGVIRVLVATSTLSSGVNLPARRVIIRTPMFNRRTLDVRTYLQMTGRAGRKGVDDEGESILVCRPNEQSSGKTLLTSKPLPVKSCLIQAGKEELTTSFKRAILEIIVNGIASTYESVMDYTNCTLLSAQIRAQKPEEVKGPMTRRRSSSLSPHHSKKDGFDKDVIESCIKWLAEHEFVLIQETESEADDPIKKRNIVATQLGRAALLSSLPTADALTVLADLHQAMKGLALDTDLHLIYLVTPIFCYNDWIGLDWYQYLNAYESMPNSQKNAATLIGVTEQFLMRMASGAPIPKRGKQAEKMGRLLGTHRRFYAALALLDLVQEVPLSDVCSKYSCNRGMLQQLQQSAASFAGMVTTFCQELGWWSLEILLREFQTRLAFGVQRELMDLMQISLLNSQRARALYAAGVTSCQLVSQSTPSKIELILRNSAHFQTGRKGVNEADWEVEERRKQRSIHVTGQRGLTENEAAIMIIEEAKKICGLQQQPSEDVRKPVTSFQKNSEVQENPSAESTPERQKLLKTLPHQDRDHEEKTKQKNRDSGQDVCDEELRRGQSSENPDGQRSTEGSKVTNDKGGLSSVGSQESRTTPENPDSGQEDQSISHPDGQTTTESNLGSQDRSKTTENIDCDQELNPNDAHISSQKDSGCGSRESSLTETQLKLVLDDDSMEESFADLDRRKAHHVPENSNSIKERGSKDESGLDDSSDSNNDLFQQDEMVFSTGDPNEDPACGDTLELLLQDADEELSVFSPAEKDCDDMRDSIPEQNKIKTLDSESCGKQASSNSKSHQLPHLPGMTLAENQEKQDEMEYTECKLGNETSEVPDSQDDIELGPRNLADDTENLEDPFQVQETLTTQDSEDPRSMMKSPSEEPVTLFLSQESDDEDLNVSSEESSSNSASPITLMLDEESSDDMLDGDDIEVPKFNVSDEIDNHDWNKENLEPVGVSISSKNQEDQDPTPSYPVLKTQNVGGKRSIEESKTSLTDSQLCAVLDGSFSQCDEITNPTASSNRSKFTASSRKYKKPSPSTKHLPAFTPSVEILPSSESTPALSPATLKAMNASFSPCNSANTSLEKQISEPFTLASVATSNPGMVSTPKDKNFLNVNTKLCSSKFPAHFNKTITRSTQKNIESAKIIPVKHTVPNDTLLSPYVSLGQPVPQSLTPRVVLTPVQFKMGEKDAAGVFSDNSLEDMFDITSPSLTNDSEIPPPSNEERRENLDTAFNFSDLSDDQSVELVSPTPEISNTPFLKRKSPDAPNSPLCEKSLRIKSIGNTPEKSTNDLCDTENLILSSQKEAPVKKRGTNRKNMKARISIITSDKDSPHRTNQSLAMSWAGKDRFSQKSTTNSNPTSLEDTAKVSRNFEDLVASSQQVPPTPSQSQELSASQAGLTIVDVCSHTELFVSFMKEWSTKTHFSIAVAARGVAQKTNGRIGISSSNTQSLRKNGEDASCDNTRAYDIAGIAVCWGQHDAYYISMEGNESDALLYNTRPEFLSLLSPPVSKDLGIDRRLKALRDSSCALLKKNCALIALDVKKQFKVLRSIVEAASAFWKDPFVAAWILDPSADQKTLIGLMNQFLPDDFHLLRGLHQCNNYGSISCSSRNESHAPARIRACAEAICSYRLMKKLKSKLNEVDKKIWDVFNKVEMPHIKSLAIMEINGIGFDAEGCVKEISNLHEISRNLEKKAYQLAKKQFNLGSPLEIAKVLFRDLGLPTVGAGDATTSIGAVKPGMWRGKRIPGSWSTKKEVLEKLKLLHPLPEVILHWRQVTFTLSKSLHPFSRVSVYSDEMKMERIHPECIAHSVTGRVSVAEPNIQNVPKTFIVTLNDKKDEERKTCEVSIRDFFVPAKGYVFIAADYSQLEIRIFAHLSGDEKLLQILNSDTGDVFKMIAAQWKGIKIDGVTLEERQRAKQICYGMLYGIGAKALSLQLNIEEKSAERFMESFLRSFPAVRAYMRTLVQQCAKMGYVETLLGRRRYLPNISDSNMSVRSQAERQAVNTTVQGSAADVIKLATVEMHKAMKKKWKIALSQTGSRNRSSTRRPASTVPGCFIVLHLHDELMFEVRTDIMPEVASLVRSCMEKAVKLKVKLPVNLTEGPSWGKLKKWE